MNYITLKEANKKWGISVRRITRLCSEGRIPGAVKRQNLWMIPSDADKPADGRKKKTLLKEPFVLFGNATHIEKCAPKDMCEYDETICKCQLLFLTSGFEECINELHRFAMKCPDRQYLLVSYIILRFAAILSGNVIELKSAKRNIDKLLKDPEVGELSKSLARISNPDNPMSCQIFFNSDRNIIEKMIPFLALQNLMRNIIANLKASNWTVMTDAEIICHTLMEMDCPQMYVYYNICLAVYYYFIGFSQNAEAHFRNALAVALPRRWYTPIIQYAIVLDLSVIDTMDHEAYENIRLLSDKVLKNYIKLNILSQGFNRSFANDLLSLQIAYQIACGKTNAEIAEHFGITLYAVKQKVSEIYLRTGYSSRTEIKDYILSHIFL